jgi:CxxC-x17-CxxC domain-containing protein
LLGPEDGAKWRQLERGLGRRIPRHRWPGAVAAIAAETTATPVESRSTAHVTRPGRSMRHERPAGAVERRNTTSSVERHTPLRDFGPTREQIEAYFARDDSGASRGPRVSQPRDSAKTGRRGRHPIVCSGCGKPAEVPFQPDPTRPVYCSACYSPRRKHAAA